MISLRIKQILEKQGKSVYWLSKTTGISANNMGNICNGETTTIRFDTIEKICLALKCTPNDIFESNEPELNKLMKENDTN